jgi:hypothetical protein
MSQGGLVSLDHTASTPVEGVDAPSRKISTTARASGLDTWHTEHPLRVRSVVFHSNHSDDLCNRACTPLAPSGGVWSSVGTPLAAKD